MCHRCGATGSRTAEPEGIVNRLALGLDDTFPPSSCGGGHDSAGIPQLERSDGEEVKRRAVSNVGGQLWRWR